MSECLDDNLLALLMEDALEAEARAEAMAHVDECDACRRLVASALRATQDDDPPRPRQGPDVAVRLSEGDGLGDYIIGQRLGAGGMGVVYAARDRTLHRDVAIKVLLRADPVSSERLRREARAQARVDHPNVCKIHSVGEKDGRPFIAMQRIAGDTLARVSPQLSLEDKVRVLRDVALGVHAAHEAGLVHRDLKPSNILCERTEAGLHPYVTDFGLVHEGASELTTAGRVLGTPEYMAPEQASGAPIDRRADVYSLGAILYELVCGEAPFSGDGAAGILLQRARSEPEPLRRRSPGAPADLETVAMRCLRAEPEARYQTAFAVAEELERFLDGRPVVARGPSLVERSGRWIRRHRGISAAAAVAIALSLVVGVVMRMEAAAERRAYVERRLGEGRRAQVEALAKVEAAEKERRAAIAAFADDRDAEGEEGWARARAILEEGELAFARAEQSLEAALVWDPRRKDARAGLADLLAARAELATERRALAEREDLLARLALYDEGGARRAAMEGPAEVRVETEPEGARIELSRFESTRAGKLEPRLLGAHGPTPLGLPPLDAGSYLLVLKAPGRIEVRAPIRLRARERTTVRVRLPSPEEVPAGFVYIPGGRYFAGTEADGLRLFTAAQPLHERDVGPFLVARYETTIGEWIDFIEASPVAERERRTPRARHIALGLIELRREGPSRWRYHLERIDGRSSSAGEGELFELTGRTQRVRQAWRRFPVSGISLEDVEAYVAWLRRIGRVPRARLCTRAELERAARGADERTYPQGSFLAPDDANVLETYGLGAHGPDEVGVHEGDRSVFGVYDLAGNIGELVSGAAVRIGACACGGDFSAETASSGIGRHGCAPRSFRAPSLGFRVCADAPERP